MRVVDTHQRRTLLRGFGKRKRQFLDLTSRCRSVNIAG
jgi:hypothetical protein